MAESQPAKGLADRVAAAREIAVKESLAAEQQRSQALTADYERASTRLRNLVKAELELEAPIQPVNFHKEHSHGSPEVDYALAKIDQFWIAVRIVSYDPSQEPLIGLIHCPNGHVLGIEYPVTDVDTWDETLLKIDETQRHYQSTDNCPNCVQARMTVRPYKPVSLRRRRVTAVV